MAIVVDKSGNNPGNPATNGWSGVDPHFKTTEELQRIYYAAGASSVFMAPFIQLNDAASARVYLGTNDASTLTTGVLDPARIPVITTAVQVFSSGAIAALTVPQQATVVAGAIVTTTDGRRWIYTGTGSKVLEASYIELSDVTPDWTVIANRPSAATTVTALATGAAGTVGASTNYSREDHAHQFPLAGLNSQVGTTYTLAATDHGQIIELNNASAITLTLPNSLPIGFNCMIAQVGAGQVTLSTAAGANMRNRQTLTKTAGQWAEISIRVRTNAGGNIAEYVVSGDMA
jgi:hypothetical protein